MTAGKMFGAMLAAILVAAAIIGLVIYGSNARQEAIASTARFEQSERDAGYRKSNQVITLQSGRVIPKGAWIQVNWLDTARLNNGNLVMEYEGERFTAPKEWTE